MGRLLDKKEAAFYARFVSAAYSIFKRERSLLQPEPTPNDIPAPYELVAWVNMSDYAFGDEVPKFYGFIGRSTEDHHAYILAIRGTEGWIEWLDDAMVHLVPFTPVPHAGRVSHGFDKIYSTLKVVKRHGIAGALAAEAVRAPEPMSGSFAEQLEQLADSLEEGPVQARISVSPAERPRRSFIVTGHSLGSALATLFVIENKDKDKFDISTSCTFASPRVGDMEFARRFNQLPLTSWRIVNQQDVVPKIPLHVPMLFDYEHVNTPYEFSSKGEVKWNAGCWHSMTTYLHWLDPTVAVDAECKP
jgi:predicted lipase